MKAAGAVVDLFTLGQAMVLTKGAGFGAKALGKTVVLELASNAAAYSTGYACNAFEVPGVVTWALSVATGCMVSSASGKYLFKNADGKIIKECTADEADEILGKLKASQAEKCIGDVKEINKVLTTAEAEEYAFNAIKGSDNADVVVLGKFDALKDINGKFILDANGNKIPTENSYNIIAEDMDAQYFQLDNWDELALMYSDEQIWKINERFLDIQTSSGRDIFLSSNPSQFIGDGSFFSKEIQYLQDNGYRFVREGEIWHAIR